MTTSTTTTPETTSPIQRYLLLGASAILLLLGIAGIALINNGEGESTADEPFGPITTVLFLGPSSEPINQIMQVVVETGATSTLTSVDGGVLEYTISPDNQWIAYTERITGRISDIWLLNIETRQTLQLTNCFEAQASCTTPAWSYNSQQVAYTRRELDPENGWTNTERVWIADINSRTSRPLFDDFEVQGRYPRWSPTNEQIAFSLTEPTGILIYDFASTETLFVPSQQGLTGIYSPDGTQFAYPTLRFGEVMQRYYTHIELLSVPTFGEDDTEPTISRISGDVTAPVEDGQAALHSDGQRVVVTRRYLDNRYTRGSQLYLIDMTTDTVTPLVVDAGYHHAAISWHPIEDWVLYQRNDLADTRRIELWLLDLSTMETRLIYDDGYMPKFLNEES